MMMSKILYNSMQIIIEIQKIDGKMCKIQSRINYYNAYTDIGR